ncbi:hypothetical protein EMEDMD4_1010008 [Sinorhizobium medicae]|uniref:Uncharacterized protein n=1 Tax=Sinorhizobium medicae TaxID=110321 RepID=A0A508WU88_9HYPH|nr:hypothetical protein EMEDMD4_1010008 [Sinorhizobium medicae]
MSCSLYALTTNPIAQARGIYLNALRLMAPSPRQQNGRRCTAVDFGQATLLGQNLASAGPLVHAQMPLGGRIQRRPIDAKDCSVAPQSSDIWLQVRLALLQAPSRPADQPIPAVSLALARQVRASAVEAGRHGILPYCTV